VPLFQSGASISVLAAGYLAALAVFAIVDFVWLGVVAKSFYREGIGHLMAPRISLSVAVVFYIVYVAGLLVFAIEPSLRPGGSWVGAAIAGAALGFFCYATYDLTNLATLDRWPLGLSVVDMAWGTLLSGLTAAAGAMAARALL
jgi:uncharacterized membrane protein